MSKSSHERMKDLIAAQMERDDLTPEDLLHLTLARRFNECPASSLGGAIALAGRRW